GETRGKLNSDLPQISLRSDDCCVPHMTRQKNATVACGQLAFPIDEVLSAGHLEPQRCLELHPNT
ncbi:MAG: hypothetical protein P8J27_12495, partial [Mariniblastus sp.]|nr:hypothetical protein [Mariniblastus sp.]